MATTYALLGATGSTGSAILRCLLQEPPKDLQLNIFVRSKAKLLRMFPEIESQQTINVSIIEGNIPDSSALQTCLTSADVVFMCIATNDCYPGLSVSQDIAAAVINAQSALRKRESSAYKTPTLLILRSITLNSALSKRESQIALGILKFALFYCYDDIAKACANVETAALEDPGLLEYVIIDPPALHDADGTERTGHSLTTTEKLSVTLSYADLGAAFCDVAEHRAQFLRQAVGISATGKVNETWGTLMGFIFQGFKSRIIG